MEMIVADLVVSPRLPNTVGVSGPLKAVMQMIKETEGIIFNTHAMGTNIQTKSLTTLLNLVERIDNHLKHEGIPRIVISLKIDHRMDKDEHTIQSKINSVNF